jgi:hypothetical protein
MTKMTVTAPNGVRLRVRVQKQETHTREIPEARNSAGDLLAPAKTENFPSWADQQIVQFASESKEFEVSAGVRIIVEDDPAA